MQKADRNTRPVVKNVFLVVALFAVAGLLYLPSLAEAAKVLLLGAALVGVSFWGRRT